MDMKKKKVMKIMILAIVLAMSVVAVGSEMNFFDMTLIELMNVRIDADANLGKGQSVDSTVDYRVLTPAVVTSLDSKF